MLFALTSTPLNALIFSYMCVYNLSLIFFCGMLLQLLITNLKTINSLTILRSQDSYVTNASIILFSMAGVPPLFGFFMKLVILLFLINMQLTNIFLFFFGLLFFGLYFYLQNLRFLHTTSKSILTRESTTVSFFKTSHVYAFQLQFFIFLLVSGVLWIDDLLLYFTWVLL